MVRSPSTDTENQTLAGPDISAEYKHRSCIDQLERGLKILCNLVNKEWSSDKLRTELLKLRAAIDRTIKRVG